jgi:hypothetical protein
VCRNINLAIAPKSTRLRKQSTLFDEKTRRGSFDKTGTDNNKFLEFSIIVDLNIFT